MSDREAKIRQAIGSIAVRIRESAARTGRAITQEQGKQEARKIAERNDRKHP